eukprot:gene9383-19470_t
MESTSSRSEIEKYRKELLNETEQRYYLETKLKESDKHLIIARTQVSELRSQLAACREQLTTELKKEISTSKFCEMQKRVTEIQIKLREMTELRESDLQSITMVKKEKFNLEMQTNDLKAENINLRNELERLNGLFGNNAMFPHSSSLIDTSSVINALTTHLNLKHNPKNVNINQIQIDLKPMLAEACAMEIELATLRGAIGQHTKLVINPTSTNSLKKLLTDMKETVKGLAITIDSTSSSSTRVHERKRLLEELLITLEDQIKGHRLALSCLSENDNNDDNNNVNVTGDMSEKSMNTKAKTTTKTTMINTRTKEFIEEDLMIQLRNLDLDLLDKILEYCGCWKILTGAVEMNGGGGGGDSAVKGGVLVYPIGNKNINQTTPYDSIAFKKNTVDNKQNDKTHLSPSFLIPSSSSAAAVGAGAVGGVGVGVGGVTNNKIRNCAMSQSVSVYQKENTEVELAQEELSQLQLLTAAATTYDDDEEFTEIGSNGIHSFDKLVIEEDDDDDDGITDITTTGGTGGITDTGGVDLQTQIDDLRLILTMTKAALKEKIRCLEASNVRYTALYKQQQETKGALLMTTVQLRETEEEWKKTAQLLSKALCNTSLKDDKTQILSNDALLTMEEKYTLLSVQCEKEKVYRYSLEEALSQSEAQCVDLQTQLKELKNVQGSLLEELALAKGSQASLQEELSVAKGYQFTMGNEIIELKKEMNENGAEVIQKYTVKFSEMREMKELLSKQLQDRDLLVIESNQQLEETWELLLSTRQRLEESEEEIQSVHKQLEDAHVTFAAELISLRGEYEGRVRQGEETMSYRRKWEETVTSLNSQNKQLGECQRELEWRKTESSAVVTDLRKEIAVLGDSETLLKKRLSQLEMELGQQSHALLVSQEEIEGYKKKVNDLCGRLFNGTRRINESLAAGYRINETGTETGTGTETSTGSGTSSNQRSVSNDDGFCYDEPYTTTSDNTNTTPCSSNNDINSSNNNNNVKQPQQEGLTTNIDRDIDRDREHPFSPSSSNNTRIVINGSGGRGEKSQQSQLSQMSTNTSTSTSTITRGDPELMVRYAPPTLDQDYNMSEMLYSKKTFIALDSPVTATLRL